VNWLLVFVPVAVMFDRGGRPAALVFFAAALAIVPLAALLVRSTEQLAERLGPAVGGLLNATFGNLPEMIIAIVALRAGLVDMVRGSLIGAILGNLLFGQGLAFLLGASGTTCRSTTRQGPEPTPAPWYSRPSPRPSRPPG
jgi:Ca2+:H+ antiporter